MRASTAAATAYVVAVAGLAAWGFGTESAAPVLLAFLLTLPVGAVALVGYYVLYGLMTLLLPGTTGPTGDLATWFAAVAGVVGVLTAVLAALLDLTLLRLLLRRRRARPVDDDSPFDVPAC